MYRKATSTRKEAQTKFVQELPSVKNPRACVRHREKGHGKTMVLEALCEMELRPVKLLEFACVRARVRACVFVCVHYGFARQGAHSTD